MKSRIWLDGNYQGETIEITVRDSSRAKLGSWVIAINDKKRARQILRTLKQTYGIDFGVKPKDDLSWLK